MKELNEYQDFATSTAIYPEDMRTMGYFEITYVHELQHALRLCGINKEIEI